MLYAFVMIVDGHSERFLRAALTDDILVEKGAKLARRWESTNFRRICDPVDFFLDDIRTETNAFVTDINRRPSYELSYFSLALATERTSQLTTLEVFS